MMIMTTLCNRACLSGNTASLARQAQRWMSSTMTTTASPTLNAAVPATATATTTTTATATTTTTATAQPPAQQPPQQQRRRRRRRGETNKVKTWEDSDYVVRRNSYNAQMQDIRKALHHRELDHKREALAKEQANQAELKELRRARSLRRREQSLVKVAVHRAKVAHAMEQSRKRAEHGFQMWKTEQERVHAMKIDAINRLNADAQNWLTPETLDAEIERVLDQWLISSTLRTDVGHIASQ